MVLEMASKTLGHLARLGTSLTADMVQFQVNQAFEWLQAGHNEKRQLAAAMVLKGTSDHTYQCHKACM